MWRQRAQRRLSVVYEHQKEYTKAIKTLEAMKICEPCGTGAAYSRMERDYRIWSLRLKCAPRKDVLAKLWESLKKPNRWSFDPKVEARYVISLYSEEQYHELKQELKVAQHAIAEEKSSNKAKALFDEISTSMLYLEKIRSSSKYLIEQIVKIGDDQHYDIKGRFPAVLTVPENPGRDNLWRARAAILALKLHNPKVLIIGLQSSMHNSVHRPLAVCALGQIGGVDAVKFLTRKLEETGTDEEALRDWFYALLLTGDANAVRIVKQATQSSKEKKRAAEWALSCFREQAPKKRKTNGE
jgi:hypothetical protein